MDPAPQPEPKQAEPIKQQQPEKKPKPRQIYNVTAYALGDGLTPSHGITASGERVKEGRTLACPKSLPFGTEIYIPKLDKTYTCADRGGMIKTGHLDVYVASIARAESFGRQFLEVEIKKPGE